LAYVILIEII